MRSYSYKKPHYFNLRYGYGALIRCTIEDSSQFFCHRPIIWYSAWSQQRISLDVFNQPLATKMIKWRNPLLIFDKAKKRNFSGEDSYFRPTVSFLDDSDSLAQIRPYYNGMGTIKICWFTPNFTQLSWSVILARIQCILKLPRELLLKYCWEI